MKHDRVARCEHAASLATAWGGHLVDVGALGHRNPAAGFGESPQTKAFIAEPAV